MSACLDCGGSECVCSVKALTHRLQSALDMQTRTAKEAIEAAGAAVKERDAVFAFLREMPCPECEGRGTWHRGCSAADHGDSTYDHNCDDEDVTCDACGGGKKMIAVYLKRTGATT